MLRLAAPVAGMRSLPVMKESSFRWLGGLERVKKSQNQDITGSESGSVVAVAIVAALGISRSLLFPGFVFGQFSYVATARRAGTSRGSSEPRTINSISSGRNSASALPPHTV